MQFTPAVIRPAGQSQSQSHLWQPVDLQAKAFRSYLQVHPVCMCVCVSVCVWMCGGLGMQIVLFAITEKERNQQSWEGLSLAPPSRRDAPEQHEQCAETWNRLHR